MEVAMMKLFGTSELKLGKGARLDEPHSPESKCIIIQCDISAIATNDGTKDWYVISSHMS
jgi:hypothetical protein